MFLWVTSNSEKIMAKIILLASYAPSLLNFRGPLLKAMVQQGHEVIACSPEIDCDIESLLLEFGVASHSVPLHRTGLNPVKDWVTVSALKKLFLREKPDAVLSYTIKPVIYGSLAARFASVPKIHAMITGLGYAFSGNTLKQKIIGKVAQVLYRFALKKNNKVFFQNPDDLDLFIRLRLIQKKQMVLINGSGVDLEYYRNVFLPKKISFLLIARLIKEKGIQEYVEAARIIRERYPGINFSLVGWIDSSPTAIDPEDLKKWQLDDLIDYKGKMEDVRPAIVDTAVYVLPSYYREGTPRTVLEAMAMGRPVITTDAPGCRETVTEGKNGYLVPSQNPVALAGAMEKLILRPELIRQMGMESRNIAEEKYDVHKVNEVILREMDLCEVSENVEGDDHDKGFF